VAFKVQELLEDIGVKLSGEYSPSFEFDKIQSPTYNLVGIFESVQLNFKLFKESPFSIIIFEVELLIENFTIDISSYSIFLVNASIFAYRSEVLVSTFLSNTYNNPGLSVSVKSVL
jgi:hypothetical protein